MTARREALQREVRELSEQLCALTRSPPAPEILLAAVETQTLPQLHSVLRDMRDMRQAILEGRAWP